MRRLDARTFTEIALSLMPLSNAPTWVKALWIEQELEERGLWRDDVFELIRPFLVANRPKNGNAKPGANKSPAKSLVDPDLPAIAPQTVKPQFTVSRPTQSPIEVKWNSDYRDDGSPEFEPARHVDLHEVESSTPIAGQTEAAEAGAAFGEGSLTWRDGLEPEGGDAPAVLEGYDPPIASLNVDDLTPEQAELASMMHLLAVSTRLDDLVDEAGIPGDVHESAINAAVAPVIQEPSEPVDEVAFEAVVEPVEDIPQPTTDEVAVEVVEVEEKPHIAVDAPDSHSELPEIGVADDVDSHIGKRNSAAWPLSPDFDPFMINEAGFWFDSLAEQRGTAEIISP